ncbi:hypothetical protein JCM8202v2_005258 [Rhodotorula sphaerocarpa]
MLRTLAARASHAAPRPSRFANKPALPLDYFVNRTKALALYRQFVRATKSLGDSRTRWETMQWIRNDFERNRAVVESARSSLFPSPNEV